MDRCAWPILLIYLYAITIKGFRILNISKTRPGINLGSIRDQFGLDLGSIRGQFGLDLGSIRTGIEKIRNNFSEILRTFRNLFMEKSIGDRS